MDPGTFSDAALGNSRTVFPVSFIGGVPFFKGQIGSSAADHMVLDNDLEVTFIMGAFSLAHPDEVKDLHGGRHASIIAPFADRNNYGLRVEVWLSNIGGLIVETLDLEGLRVIATNYPFKIAGQAVDGILGSNVLELYDVYLDYPHERVVLVPNTNFHKMFKPKPAATPHP